MAVTEMGGHTIKGDTSGLTAVPNEEGEDGSLWYVGPYPVGLPEGGDSAYWDEDSGQYRYPLDLE